MNKEAMQHLKDIERAIEFSIWLDQQIAGANFVSDEGRRYLSWKCQSVAMDHGNAILLLLNHKIYSSAAALIRLLFEAYLRGVWLLDGISEKEVSKIEQAQQSDEYKFPEVKKMLSDLKKEAIEISNWLEEFYEAYWNALNDHTHTGIRQLISHRKDNSIEPNLSSEEISEMANAAIIFSSFAALEVCRISESHDIAKAIYERFRENGYRKPEPVET